MGYVDNGVFHEIFPLDLKGRFYASISFRPKGGILCHACCFVHNGDILHKVFWHISALVFEYNYDIIKGRLYANHIMSGVKLQSMILHKHKGELCAANLPLLILQWAGLSMHKGSY